MTRQDPHLEGAPNFRDLGGYRTASGQTVRHGRIYRAGALDRLTDADITQLRALGIALICDIRSPEERKEAPNRWRERHDIGEIHIDTSAEMKHANANMLVKLRDDPSHERALDLMHQVYRAMPRAFDGKLHELFDHLLAGDKSGPVVIHCTAGKDRTGFVCALLLLALGVPRETVYADYLVSGDEERSGMLRHGATQAMTVSFGMPPHPGVVEALIGVQPAYLDLAFDTLRTEYGSIEAYLERSAGLDAGRLDALRRSLLD